MMLSGVSFAGGVLQDGPGGKVLSGNYTIPLSENGFTYELDGAADITITLPANAPYDFQVTIVQATVSHQGIIQMPGSSIGRIDGLSATSAGGQFTWPASGSYGKNVTLRRMRPNSVDTDWWSAVAVIGTAPPGT